MYHSCLCITPDPESLNTKTVSFILLIFRTLKISVKIEMKTTNKCLNCPELTTINILLYLLPILSFDLTLTLQNNKTGRKRTG